MWSFILTAVGISGFFLAGRKVWWAWYINIGCQVLWTTYAIVTEQYGFIIAALFYTAVFGKNAWEWTKEHREKQKYPYLHKDPWNYLYFTPGSEGVAVCDALGIDPKSIIGDDPIKYVESDGKASLLYTGCKSVTLEELKNALFVVEKRHDGL